LEKEFKGYFFAWEGGSKREIFGIGSKRASKA